MNCIKLLIKKHEPVKKAEKISLIRKIIGAFLILSIATTIIGNGSTWTPLMTLFTGLLLYGEHRLNGAYRAKARADKKAEKARQKKARSAGTLTSKKVIPFKNNTIAIIDIEEGKVKCI